MIKKNASGTKTMRHGLVSGRGTKKAAATSGSGPSGDALLLESGDYLLLESGDFLLLE